ncbi:MAG: hypothetical protein ACRCZ0_09615, partial [Cetobacterium sp.]
MRQFVYVLRNKKHGMWFYEHYNKEIKDWEQREVSSLEDLEGARYLLKDLAESWCEFYSRRYNLQL